MNSLNGWQRIWVVLLALWAVPVGFFGLQNLPRFDGREWSGLPDPGVSKYMPTPAWLGSECDGTELQPGERIFRDNENQEWTGERWRVSVPPPFDPKEFAGFTPDPTPPRSPDQLPDDLFLRVPSGEFVRAKVNSDAHIALCFDARLSDVEMNRILAEYATAYRSAWRRAVVAHAGIGAVYWLAPGIALYALSWSVGWVRRGFENETRGVVDPVRTPPPRVLIVIVGWIVMAWALLIIVSNAIAAEPSPWPSSLAAALATAVYGVTLIQRNRRAVSLTWIAVAVFGAAVIFGGLVPMMVLVWGLLVAFAFYLRKYQSELQSS